MAKNASTVSGNSNLLVEEEAHDSVLKLREEPLELNVRAKKKKNKKRKNRNMEVNESAARFLYCETPSEESEGVLPSPRMVKTKKLRPFSKVWSDEDEITILEGIIRFKTETGLDAAQNMVIFYPFIRKSLVLDATLIQVREKVRRFREKYAKSAKNGSGSRTVHEEKLFHLCEEIWTVNAKQEPEQPNSSRTGEHQNLLVNWQGEKENVPEMGQREKLNTPEIGRPRLIPETGLSGQAFEAVLERLWTDMDLVINSKAYLHGNQKAVDKRALDLYFDCSKLRIKFGTLVYEKASSPELRDSPELLEQEVLRIYLEMKIELIQLLLNAYNSFTKVTIISAPAKHMKKGRREAENEIEKLVSRKKQKKHVAVAQAAEKKKIDANRKEKKNKKQESSSSDDSLKKDHSDEA
ncbi:uncharacterized protein LOC132033221 isoform X2 [Lycium ferocissimum]|uniref:uncharacterized protein LOC132033221 isoform X2 n=1 Tax=Lycium ferocissimum TaxID=112874 RepID=UPI0028151C0D|nr:uncharacterized protein LOC132033221 isoform X2 [Lycium ferocissimum]